MVKWRQAKKKKKNLYNKKKHNQEKYIKISRRGQKQNTHIQQVNRRKAKK